MKITQVRNATLVVDYAGRKFLIDPMLGAKGRAIRFSENVVADIGEWTSTWGRRALDFGGRVGYHDCNQI